ncbi:hypothetical protein DACRYDRAFT_25439 [Dacryopinax primogenitus]|uniref:N-acetyltransferase domain-containing protein n=1 Tax=Dacryopinax primogenitus (strain DJM 731) TaxID=1858805 RepID=M5FPF3_DACPD|nr:uncharacterized protein DACRYDRAFT_25439 [Dacryopinax primogenitus]EJT97033.1 hypothetical protein DACRYDRAFT_25439 [Dacryopinax primogenitus]
MTTSPRLVNYPTPSAFLRACLPFDTWHMNISLGPTLQYLADSGDFQPAPGEAKLWLAVWTGEQLDLTLVRTSKLVTLCSPLHSSFLSQAYLEPRMTLLAESLHALITSRSQPPLSTLTGPTTLVQAFVPAYRALSSLQPREPAVIHTLHTHCPSSRVSPAPPLPEGYQIRPVKPGDPRSLEALAHMLLDFRNLYHGPWPALSLVQAREHAEEAVRLGEVLVYVVPSSSGEEGEEFTGFVRDGRLTRRFAAVRNVFTRPSFRRRGVAEALTRAAVLRLLGEPHRLATLVAPLLSPGEAEQEGKRKVEEVCIFAEDSNLSAQGIYGRVGFGFPCGDWGDKERDSGEGEKSWEECVEVAYPE